MPLSTADRAPEVGSTPWLETEQPHVETERSGRSPRAQQLQNAQLGTHPRGPVLPLGVGILVVGGPV